MEEVVERFARSRDLREWTGSAAIEGAKTTTEFKKGEVIEVDGVPDEGVKEEVKWPEVPGENAVLILDRLRWKRGGLVARGGKLGGGGR